MLKYHLSKVNRPYIFFIFITSISLNIHNIKILSSKKNFAAYNHVIQLNYWNKTNKVVQSVLHDTTFIFLLSSLNDNVH